MADKPSASGMMMPYGQAIGNALSRSDTPIDDLIALRDHAHAIVNAQGDLVEAVKSLDAALTNRGNKTLPDPAPPSERFIVEIAGFAVSDALKTQLDDAIQKAVMTEIGKIDTAGTMIATPLSQIRDFGIGQGSKTPGLYLRSKAFAVR